MTFRRPQTVLFRHCDPARIVFFPRYFEMLNDLVEAFFETVPGHSFAAMHPARGVPTARIETVFAAPSRMGERLELSLDFTRIGATSATTAMRATCDGQERLRAASVLVHVGADTRPLPWPDDLRAALAAHLTGETT